MRLGRLVASGIVLGVGLGSFVDGIVLHQILQWHHMVSSAGFPPTSVENLQLNTFWDGLFHAFAWLVTVAGLALLWRARGEIGATGSTRAFVGALPIGWGAFNLVEGTLNHLVLGIHHVREGVPNPLAWDLGFLVLSVVILIAGWMIVRSGIRQAEQATREERPRRAA